MKNSDFSFLSPYFLGEYAENSETLENLVTEFIRDHVYWRRNFHPEDEPIITAETLHSSSHLAVIDSIKRELHKLTAALKKSVPVFNRRYIGHMCTDLLLPGLIAHIVTTLYNPNNVTFEVSPVTLDLEFEVGLQLAQMLGFNCDETKNPCAWGHLTSGGTVANIESLWHFRSAKYFPLALKDACQELGINLTPCKSKSISLTSDWEMMNFSINEVMSLHNTWLKKISQFRSIQKRQKCCETLKSKRVETLGLAEFHRRHPDLELPVLLAPASAHYSWEKAVKLCGLGSQQLLPVAIDSKMRAEPGILEEMVMKLHHEQRPILGVIAILGNTEFGSIDPLHDFLKIRRSLRKRGGDFYIHVDAAWGGYITTMFKSEKGDWLSRKKLSSKFNYFPSQQVYKAFTSIPEVDSVTIDPHKQGYLPFGVGGIISRNRDIIDLISLEAPYVFEAGDRNKMNFQEKFRQLGRYILEGSKSGAHAAAVSVTHKILPLHATQFGRIVEQTIHSSEYFFDRILKSEKKLAGKAILKIPFEPDTNLVCIGINPVGNRSLAKMNNFGRKIYEHIMVDENQPVQIKEFFGSKTLIHRKNLSAIEAKRLCKLFSLDEKTYTSISDENGEQASGIFMLRHTLMNPLLCLKQNGNNMIDRYCTYLEQTILDTLDL